MWKSYKNSYKQKKPWEYTFYLCPVRKIGAVVCLRAALSALWVQWFAIARQPIAHYGTRH